MLPFLWAQDGFSEPSTEMAEAIRFGLEAPKKLSMLGTVIMMIMMMMMRMMMMMMLQEASCCWWWGRPCAWGRCSGGWSPRRSSDSDCYCGLQDKKCHVLSFYDMIIFAVTLCLLCNTCLCLFKIELMLYVVCQRDNIRYCLLEYITKAFKQTKWNSGCKAIYYLCTVSMKINNAVCVIVCLNRS